MNALATGSLSPAEIAASCESIGRNCEFGLVQREFGLEPIHLLRWAGSQMPGLVAAFENGFEGLADEMTGTREETPEGHPHSRWMLTCQRYGIAFHVEAPREANHGAEAGEASAKRLRWMADRLLQGVADNERVLIYSSRHVTSAADCAALVAAIRRHGEAPVLLVGQTPDGRGLVGTTRWPAVWFADMPSVTRMDWAGGADIPAWTKMLKNFAAAIEHV